MCSWHVESWESAGARDSSGMMCMICRQKESSIGIIGVAEIPRIAGRQAD